MTETQVKFMILMGSLSMTSTTITHVCAGCKVDGIFSKCEVCLAFQSEKGSLFFQLGIFAGFSYSNIHFTDLCSVCTTNDDEMDCQECTTFVAIKAILESEPCSECSPTTIEAKEGTEKTMSETQNPSIFEYNPSTLAVKDGTEQATSRTYSRSSFEYNPSTLAVEDGTEQVTSRAYSRSSFECEPCSECSSTTIEAKEGTEKIASETQSPSIFEYETCPECSPTSTVAKVREEEEAFRTKIQLSSDDLLGYVFGSVLGGVLFGSITVTLLFIVIRQREEKRKREQTSDALHNLAESGNNQQLVQDHGKESRRASLNINNKRKKGHEETTEFIVEEDGVYNHLNESETVEKDEYYDHARAGAPVQSENNNDDYDHAGPSFLTVSTIDDYAA